MSKFRHVTPENWDVRPHIQWSFQHVQELFPTCRLARAPSASLALPVEPCDLTQLRFEAADGEPTSIGEFLADAYCDAFLVVRNGRMVAEHYFNGMTGDSHHLLNSVTKTFVGMLAGIAVERGQLDPSALLTRYLPELDNSAWHGTTVRHLLDMTAAVRYAENYADPDTDFWKESAVVGWRPALVDGDTPRTLFDYARSLRGQDMENGSKFEYRTVTANVIGMILERVMGTGLANLLGTEIWSRLAPQHDASIVVDPSGFPYVGAGMSASASDLANFGLMMIQDGVLNGRQVVPAGWIADTANGDSASKECFAKAYPEFPGWHYRNQVWVARSKPAVMLAIGIHGQYVYMDKGRDLVIVMLSSLPQPFDANLDLDTLAGMQAIGSWLAAHPSH